MSAMVDTALAVVCPGCGAEEGVMCKTLIDGIDMGWTHDSRFYAAAGWAHLEQAKGGDF